MVTTELGNNLATLEGTVGMDTKDIQSRLMVLEAHIVPPNVANTRDNPPANVPNAGDNQWDSTAPAVNAGDNPQDPPTSDQRDAWDRHYDNAGNTTGVTPPQQPASQSPTTASRAAATWAHFHADRCIHPSTAPTPIHIHTPHCSLSHHQPVQNPYSAPQYTFCVHPPPNQHQPTPPPNLCQTTLLGAFQPC